MLGKGFAVHAALYAHRDCMPMGARLCCKAEAAGSKKGACACSRRKAAGIEAVAHAYAAHVHEPPLGCAQCLF